MPEPRRSVETEARVAAAAILEDVFDASQELGEVVDPLCAHVGQGDLLVKREGRGRVEIERGHRVRIDQAGAMRVPAELVEPG
ncbi:MAG: hypothetical protein GW913_13570 [Myxococcales bacterium]|nr:hypothetical protein [Myxococcales bacterium]